jgi:glycolate oxidase FAD binding subunit
MDFVLSELCEQVMTARAGHKPLFICGGGTKSFYGNHRPLRPQDGHCLLDIAPYRGIVNYQPTELFVTVRAGTPLAELEAALDEQGQMLAFEPPYFGDAATIGGCVAAGLAGPRRMAAGSVRDFVLGAKLLDAHGRVLSFGGEVMKNVAGYDMSRLLTGSLGIFGAIVEVSLKVMPKPLQESTLCFDADEAQALRHFAQWRGSPLAISASCWVPRAATGAGGAQPQGGQPVPGQVWVRLSGSPPAIEAAHRAIGGSVVDETQARVWWNSLREQTHPFFERSVPLWRVAVPPATPPLDRGPTLIEWGGGQRWLSGHQDAKVLRAAAHALGGHATLFRAARAGDLPTDGVFHPLSPAVAAITRRLKQELDPVGLFNPGRLTLEL